LEYRPRRVLSVGWSSDFPGHILEELPHRADDPGNVCGQVQLMRAVLDYTFNQHPVVIEDGQGIRMGRASHPPQGAVFDVLVGISNLPNRGTIRGDVRWNGGTRTDRRPRLHAHVDAATKCHNGQFCCANKLERRAAHGRSTLRIALPKILDPLEKGLSLIKSTCCRQEVPPLFVRMMSPKGHPRPKDWCQRNVTVNALTLPFIDIVQLDLQILDDQIVARPHMASTAIVFLAITQRSREDLPCILADRDYPLGQQVAV